MDGGVGGTAWTAKETTDLWPLLTVETEANARGSRNTEWALPWLVGPVVPVQEIFSCLGCSN